MLDNRQIIFFANDTGDNSDEAPHRLCKKDRRILWHGLILANSCMALFFCLFIFFYTNRIKDHHKEQAEQFLKTAAAYAVYATDDEYDAIAQTLRHDLILSEYSGNIKDLAAYIPNTADMCCLEKKFSAQAYIVCTNTGEIYPMDIFPEGESADIDYTVGYLGYGYDEISQSNICITRNPGLNRGSVTLYHGKSIVSIQRMKSVFCEECIEELLDIITNCQIKEFIIFDRTKRVFYPIHDGSKFRIGDYELEITYTDGNFEITVVYAE